MIRKLPQNIINQIAAGEVIQRPYNVIKQLVENSIDAHSTIIMISILTGGLKSIKIIDNGQGISKENFPLLCVRHATSKISQLQDLNKLQSFGFRGEALASLSYVSRLQIVSKYYLDNNAYRAQFKDQNLISSIEPVSYNVGTKITANDLFYNLQTRRASLNPLEQKKKIIKLIYHFALHYSNIKFRLQSQKGTQLSTQTIINKNQSQTKMFIFQQITKLSYDKLIYLPLEKIQNIKIQCILSKLNSIQGKTLLLNINNRIVQNQQIHKSIVKAYSQCYRSIHQQVQSFYAYISIQIDPKRIDCNVHPAKKFVGFFNGDGIYQCIYSKILNAIKQQSAIKTINTQSQRYLSVLNNHTNQSSMNLNNPFQSFKSKLGLLSQPNIQTKITQQRIYAHSKNRTDNKQLPITFYSQQQIQNKFQFKYKFQQKLYQKKQQVQNCIVSKFFRSITYVGCFNLNYLFIHYQNKLYMLNIIPFLYGFLKTWLKDHSLMIHKHYQAYQIKQLIPQFLQKYNLIDSIISIKQLIDKIIYKRQNILKRFGIFINENGQIIQSPILMKYMHDSINKYELMYFLCRISNKQNTRQQQQKYFLQYLSTLFENHSDILSPFNNYYSNFMRDQLIPSLKIKARHDNKIIITNYMKLMLDLKDVYQIFERC